MATSPVGLLLIIRLCRNAIRCSGTPSALASGPRCSSQILAIVARSR